MPGVLLLYYLPIYLILTILSYEYVFKYIITSFTSLATINLSEAKLRFNTSFTASNLKFNILFLGIFLSSQRYVLLPFTQSSTVFTFLLIIIIFWGLVMYKNFFFFLIEQKNLTLVSLTYYLSILFLFSFLLVENLIIFLLLLELVAVLYYFFFLNYLDKVYFSLIKYKNFLILYLLSSFITTIFFCIGLVFLSIEVGSLHFLQLNYMTVGSCYGFIFILISLSWKLGLPGMHFFKLELYTYLPLTLIFFFSSTSILLNLFIFILFFNIFFGILSTYLFLLSLFILLSINVLLSRGFRGISGYQFIAYSALVTLVVIILSLSIY